MEGAVERTIGVFSKKLGNTPTHAGEMCPRWWDETKGRDGPGRGGLPAQSGKPEDSDRGRARMRVAAPAEVLRRAARRVTTATPERTQEHSEERALAVRPGCTTSVTT